MCPASRTASSSSARSSAGSNSCSGNGHAFHAQSWRIRAVAKDEIIGRCKVREHLLEVSGDRHFRNGIGAFAVLDPKTGGTPAIVAGDAVHSHSDQFGHAEALA